MLPVPHLVDPHPRYRDSFLEAMAEFAEEGRTGDGSMVGSDLVDFAGTWATPDGFAAYVARLRHDSVEPRRPDWVLTTSLWWVEAEQWLGRVSVRHTLGNDFLREVGGHVGYDVRRSARRRGHATAMLGAALPVAQRLGIERALISCDLDNEASRRTIEANGGEPDGQRQGKLRFWVPTG